MHKVQILHWYKRHFILYTIFLVLSIVIFSIVGFIAYMYLRFTVLDKRDEAIIDKKFHAEVATLPQIKVDKFMLWEGDSMVTLNITNKGSVSFWYGKDGVPRIQSIGQYPLPFVCYYVDNQGNKTNYAYDTALVLDRNTTMYKEWFPFEVNNLQDLVNRYDDIIKSLSKLPKNPEMKDFQDSWGKRSVVKNPDPNFILKPPPPSLYTNTIQSITGLFIQNGVQQGKDLACDLYTRAD